MLNLWVDKSKSNKPEESQPHLDKLCQVEEEIKVDSVESKDNKDPSKVMLIFLLQLYSSVDYHINQLLTLLSNSSLKLVPYSQQELLLINKPKNQEVLDMLNSMMFKLLKKPINN